MLTMPKCLLALSLAAVLLAPVAEARRKPPTGSFADNFSTYGNTGCLADGTMFGAWRVQYAGYGCVRVVNDPSLGSWLGEKPKAAATAGETHAAMVVGPHFAAPYAYSVNVKTVTQLRSPPNPWEVGWVVWGYSDDTHFYYLALKPNGWELGKEDPAYPGAQRYLRTGSMPQFPVGADHDVRVISRLDGSMTVTVDGVKLVDVTDTEQPYLSGRIGLYDEDAKVQFRNVAVTAW